MGQYFALDAAEQNLLAARVTHQLLARLGQIEGRNHDDNTNFDTATLLRQVKVRRSRLYAPSDLVPQVPTRAHAGRGRLCPVRPSGDPLGGVRRRGADPPGARGAVEGARGQVA